jgi:hypothetical protein
MNINRWIIQVNFLGNIRIYTYLFVNTSGNFS